MIGRMSGYILDDGTLVSSVLVQHALLLMAALSHLWPSSTLERFEPLFAQGVFERLLSPPVDLNVKEAVLELLQILLQCEGHFRRAAQAMYKETKEAEGAASVLDRLSRLCWSDHSCGEDDVRRLRTRALRLLSEVVIQYPDGADILTHALENESADGGQLIPRLIMLINAEMGNVAEDTVWADAAWVNHHSLPKSEGGVTTDGERAEDTTRADAAGANDRSLLKSEGGVTVRIIREGVRLLCLLSARVDMTERAACVHQLFIRVVTRLTRDPPHPWLSEVNEQGMVLRDCFESSCRTSAMGGMRPPRREETD